MKFLYQYRTPDNKQHRGVISAPTKEAVYAELRARGIRPGRVEEAPGVLNKLFGKGKRWLAIGALCIVSAVLAFVAHHAMKATDSVLHQVQQSALGTFNRHQIFGDAAIVKQGVAENWRDVFPRASDRFLSCYAQPGIAVSPMTEPMEMASVIADMEENLDAPSVRVADMDIDEVKQIKRIVSGMRQELVEYVRDGGTVEQYVKCLIERQKYEVGLRNRVKDRIRVLRRTKRNQVEFIAEWKKANSELRAFGIAMVPMDVDD